LFRISSSQDIREIVYVRRHIVTVENTSPPRGSSNKLGIKEVRSNPILLIKQRAAVLKKWRMSERPGGPTQNNNSTK
jgi:hypothetical protein